MLIVLSPAKNLDFSPLERSIATTTPRLSSDTQILSKRTKRLSRSDIKRLMKLSDNLAELNFTRFQDLAKGLPDDDAKPAALAFNGDVYRGLQASSLSDADLDWAQSHLRILSGLYGILRPLDLIHPYRLEMGTRLDTRRGENLYDFWGDRLAKQLNRDLADCSGAIINLASKEYFSAVKRKSVAAPIIDIEFRERKDGVSKIISFYAKFARGLMARWIIEQRMDDPNELKRFTTDGYRFVESESTPQLLVFERLQPPAMTR